MKFSDEHDAESFMENQAKWHNSCYLKFAPSKLSRMKGKKRLLELCVVKNGGNLNEGPVAFHLKLAVSSVQR